MTPIHHTNWHDEEFAAGYHDGRNLDAPPPSDNRSNCYRHSFMIGRCEKLGNPVPLDVAVHLADLAQRADGDA